MLEPLRSRVKLTHYLLWEKRNISPIFFILLFPVFPYSREVAPQDNEKVALSDSISVPGKGPPEKQLKDIKTEKVKLLSDTTGNEPKKSALIDTTVQNKYGDLLNDDTVYNKKRTLLEPNKKRPLWEPASEVLGADVFTWSVDRYLFDFDYAHIGPSTWKYNLQKGWEWDRDRFGINFVGHPYMGSLDYNAGRANGYDYYQSSLFSVAGSLGYEYFGENTRPSFNDQIETSLNGAFLGEIFYRVSSNILDDRTRGFERVWRELLAGLIDPMRGLNRIVQGETFRRTNKEVYQKEPLDISLYAGMHKINAGSSPFSGQSTYSEMVNIQLDYGNPFEIIPRKPFDFFKLRTEVDFGVGRKFLSNASGYGILFGKNMDYGENSLLLGAFQYYDYWDNKTFELGAIGFGGGAFYKLHISKAFDLYTNVHAVVIPFAGNSTHFGPDSSQFRDYDFCNGVEGKFETTLNWDKYATASLIYYQFAFRTFKGQSGDNLIGIFKPRVTVQVYKDLSIGFENFVYLDDRNVTNSPAINSVRTEQKLFLSLYFEDLQRRGHYN